LDSQLDSESEAALASPAPLFVFARVLPPARESCHFVTLDRRSANFNVILTFVFALIRLGDKRGWRIRAKSVERGKL
jgi:hypothetical protein